MKSRPFSDFPRNEQGLVDNFIGTAYDVVKSVADNLTELNRIDAVLDDIDNLATNTANAAVAESMVPVRVELAEAIAEAKAAETSSQNYANQSQTSANAANASNQALRDDLSGPNASAMFGHHNSTVGATLDGLTDGLATVDQSLDTLGSTVQNVSTKVDGIESAVSKVNTYPSQHFGSINGGQLSKLRLALTNPFMQFLGVCLIGDSITWGMTASGIAPILPRNGTLLDARNNGSSPTWANLLHKYLGYEYYSRSPVEEAIWAGTSNGVAQFTYTDSIDLFPGISPFTQIGSFGQLVDTSTTLGVFWYVNMGISGSGPHSFTWTMTGNSFDLRFGATPEGAEYKVFIDGVQQGDKYKTSSTDLGLPESAYRQSRTHDFSFKKNAVIRIEAVGGNASRDTLRIESVRINRKIRVTNQGIIGIASDRYLNVILNDAVRFDDSFCFIQLGTNDRGMPPGINAATSPLTLRRNISLIIDSLSNKGIYPILMCANEVANNSLPTYYYGMGEVRNALASLAVSRGIDFIDQFALTSRLSKANISYLDDELHPNDFGHSMMFENARNCLESTIGFPEAQDKDVVTLKNGFTITKFANGNLELLGPAGATASVAANATQNGSINLPVDFLRPANTVVSLNVVPTGSFDFQFPVAYMDNSSGSLVQYIIKNGAIAQTFNLRLLVKGRWKEAQ